MDSLGMVQAVAAEGADMPEPPSHTSIVSWLEEILVMGHPM